MSNLDTYQLFDLYQYYKNNPVVENRNRFIEESLALIISVCTKYRYSNFLLDFDDYLDASVEYLIKKLPNWFSRPVIAGNITGFIYQDISNGCKILLNQMLCSGYVKQLINNGTATKRQADLYDLFMNAIALDAPIKTIDNQNVCYKNIIPDNLNLEISFFKNYIQEIIKNAIISLPDKHQVVLLLYYYEDYSYKNLSDKFGITHQAVGVRLNKAKQTLRHYLHNTGFNYDLLFGE